MSGDPTSILPGAMARPSPEIDELRRNPLFHGLDDEQLGWLAGAGEHLAVPDGTVIFAEGQPATRLVVLLDGELVITHVVDGRQETLTRHTVRTVADPDHQADKPSQAHGFTGETPLLAEADYIATATAIGPTKVMRYTRTAFLEMIVRCPQVCRVLLPVLAWRIHASAAQAGQRARLAALGTLAAGLAHELNNPAAAVVRAAEDLGAALDELQSAVTSWAGAATPADAAALEVAAAELAAMPVRIAGRDGLADADAEEAVEDWLDAHALRDRGLVAALVERGLDDRWLDDLAGRLPERLLAPAIAQLGAVVAARGLVTDIAEAGQRISGIVASARDYTNLDRAPEQSFDPTQGIEATLGMLAPKLAGIRVHREYDPTLPAVAGYPSELNQVWTNLIDNAADAMGGSGDLWLRTSREGSCLRVEVIDSGPGIPPEAQDRIFDPFFTTKDIGKGTGLGLHLSQRIVSQRHRGSLTVQSRPGRTRFAVRIPFEEAPA